VPIAIKTVRSLESEINNPGGYVRRCGRFWFAVGFVTLNLFGNIESDQIFQQAATQGYHLEFIGLVEMIYGAGFLSQGGEESINQMFEGIDLDGCTLLDIGSGLGTPLIHIAKNHAVVATGIEAQGWMVTRANSHLKSVCGKLLGSVNFLNTNNLRQFEDQSFDIVMSKEVILHIPVNLKEEFFQEVYRVLKPGGRLVVLDWMHSSPNYSSETRRMMEIDEVAYNLVHPEEYIRTLKNAGFSEISIKNITSEYAKLSAGSFNRAVDLKPVIESRYGNEAYQFCLESWSLQRKAFESEELLAGIVYARKL